MNNKTPPTNWDNYHSFLAVMEGRSLSAAARQLGLSQPTIGRHIDALEEAIGENLFIRSRYGLSPTRAAENMLVHARAMAASAAAIRRAAHAEDKIEGTIRLTASGVIGVEVLPPILAKFHRKYPLVTTELVITNRTENLLKREADIAIRMVRPVQEALVARKIGDVPLGLYAHQSYIDFYGAPESFDDIGNHFPIGPESSRYFDTYAGDIDTVQLQSSLTFKSDSDLAQLALIRAGCGIGGIQKQLAARNPSLVPVLADDFVLPMEMWLVTHEDTINNRIIRVLFDHLGKDLHEYVSGDTGSR